MAKHDCRDLRVVEDGQASVESRDEISDKYRIGDCDGVATGSREQALLVLDKRRDLGKVESTTGWYCYRSCSL